MYQVSFVRSLKGQQRVTFSLCEHGLSRCPIGPLLQEDGFLSVTGSMNEIKQQSSTKSSWKMLSRNQHILSCLKHIPNQEQYSVKHFFFFLSEIIKCKTCSPDIFWGPLQQRVEPTFKLVVHWIGREQLVSTGWSSINWSLIKWSKSFIKSTQNR